MRCLDAARFRKEAAAEQVRAVRDAGGAVVVHGSEGGGKKSVYFRGAQDGNSLQWKRAFVKPITS